MEKVDTELNDGTTKSNDVILLELPSKRIHAGQQGIVSKPHMNAASFGAQCKVDSPQVSCQLDTGMLPLVAQDILLHNSSFRRRARTAES